MLIEFLAEIATKGKLKFIKSDNLGEFAGYEFKFLLSNSLIMQETLFIESYSPYQNGKRETGQIYSIWPDGYQ